MRTRNVSKCSILALCLVIKRCQGIQTSLVHNTDASRPIYTIYLKYYRLKTLQFKRACKDDSGYITQLKEQKSKRWYYLAAHRRIVNVLTSNITFLIFCKVFNDNICCFINLALCKLCYSLQDFSHVFTAHAQKQLYMNFRLKFWHRQFDSVTPFSLQRTVFRRFKDVFCWFLGDRL